MGCANSAYEDEAMGKKMNKANQDIKNHMKHSERTDKSVKKLLLLGTGSSGKSTLFKSLKDTHTPFNEQDLAESCHVIRQNIVAGILTILKKSQELYDKDPEANGACLVNMNDDIVASIQCIVNFGSEPFTEALNFDDVKHLGDSVHAVWSMESVRATFNRRGGNYSFPDNMDYFFNKVQTVMSEQYCPDKEDMLKARVRTTGVIHYNYEAKDNKFDIYDVGGQRNERKKWIHQFQSVAAVLFVLALNHYDAVLFEDEKKNAMHEAVALFKEICSSKWFIRSEMILFLNKDDLFKEKMLQQIPLDVCFTEEVGWEGKQWECANYEATGDDAVDREEFKKCYDEAIQFITDIFVECNTIPNKVVFTHVTCATDVGTVERVFWDVQNIAIRSNLRSGGLMV